jgi:hypothetical protein
LYCYNKARVKAQQQAGAGGAGGAQRARPQSAPSSGAAVSDSDRSERTAAALRGYDDADNAEADLDALRNGLVGARQRESHDGGEEGEGGGGGGGGGGEMPPPPSPRPGATRTAMGRLQAEELALEVRARNASPAAPVHEISERDLERQIAEMLLEQNSLEAKRQAGLAGGAEEEEEEAEAEEEEAEVEGGEPDAAAVGLCRLNQVDP